MCLHLQRVNLTHGETTGRKIAVICNYVQWIGGLVHSYPHLLSAFMLYATLSTLPPLQKNNKKVQSTFNTEKHHWSVINHLCLNAHLRVFVCISSQICFSNRAVEVHACMRVCVLPQRASKCSLPVRSINARPCPRLICHSRCIFAFILICTSPLNCLSAPASAQT